MDACCVAAGDGLLLVPHTGGLIREAGLYLALAAAVFYFSGDIVTLSWFCIALLAGGGFVFGSFLSLGSAFAPIYVNCLILTPSHLERRRFFIRKRIFWNEIGSFEVKRKNNDGSVYVEIDAIENLSDPQTVLVSIPSSLFSGDPDSEREWLQDAHDFCTWLNIARQTHAEFWASTLKKSAPLKLLVRQIRLSPP